MKKMTVIAAHARVMSIRNLNLKISPCLERNVTGHVNRIHKNTFLFLACTRHEYKKKKKEKEKKGPTHETPNQNNLHPLLRAAFMTANILRSPHTSAFLPDAPSRVCMSGQLLLSITAAFVTDLQRVNVREEAGQPELWVSSKGQPT